MSDRPGFERRRFLQILGAGSALALLPIGVRVLAMNGDTGAAAMAPTGADVPDWSALDESQWRARLTAAQFDVLREEGTERPNSSPLNQEKRDGTFVCAGCALPLFSSETKYDSGTGWPSFWAPLDGALGTRRDFKLLFPRTEYHCSRCGGHQGHVFEDGPRPTGLRYCNNGVALQFQPGDAA